MATNFKSLNELEDKVIINPALYKEVEDLACKQHCIGGEYHFMDTIQSNEVKDMVPHPPTLESGGYCKSL